MTTFSNLISCKKILSSLDEIGFQTATPIQELAIPVILKRGDLIASAQTGTGKTAAFMLPILQLMSDGVRDDSGSPTILILVPTRELAMQVASEAERFSRKLSRIKTICLYGGVPLPLQYRMLRKPHEIIVATPGRLLDLLRQGRVDLSAVKIAVFDEADRMLDMGFIADVEAIAEYLPVERQTLLFSATIGAAIVPLTKKLLNQPQQIHATADTAYAKNISQQLYYVDNIGHKVRLLDHILANTPVQQAIVFTATIQQANILSLHLRDRGYSSAPLHGDMQQKMRTRTINRLRSGEVQILTATDVAARGIDISSLSHVINFDLPFHPDDFIHRIGRTGRAGSKGMAITFATYQDEPKLTKIHRLVKTPLELCTIAGLEPQPRSARTIHPARGNHRSKAPFSRSRPLRPRERR